MEEDPDDQWKLPKIYYCSRTHSQLTQFLKELGKTPFADKHVDARHLNVTTVPLASRKQLCIHPSVKRLRDASSMNEKCLELRDKAAAAAKEGGVSNCGCNLANKQKVTTMRKEILVRKVVNGMARIGMHCGVHAMILCFVVATADQDPRHREPCDDGDEVEGLSVLCHAGEHRRCGLGSDAVRARSLQKLQRSKKVYVLSLICFTCVDIQCSCIAPHEPRLE